MTLDNKSDDELINLLKHQEELMRGRALELLYEKVLKVAVGQESESLLEKLREQPKALVRTLNTKIVDSLRMTITILVQVMDGTTCSRLLARAEFRRKLPRSLQEGRWLASSRQIVGTSRGSRR